MKKVLALTLVLVMAFASSAMAAVNFSGKFTATFEQKNFKLGTEPYTLKPTLEFTMNASNKNTTSGGEGEKDVVNWDLSAGLNLVDSKFELGKYKLVLNDEYFTASIWGNEQELTDKATAFDMIKAKKKADTNTMRARLEVPVLELADITVDFQPQNNIRAFVDAEVAGFDIGVAYARKNWSATDAANVVVAEVGTEIDAAGVTIGLEAAAGFDIKSDLGFAVGFGADVDLTSELNVAASVTHANDKWTNGDALKADTTVLEGTVTWQDKALKATGTVTQTFAGTDKNEIDLDVYYRFSDKLGYNDLFKSDKWYTNNAPAVHAFADLTDLKLDEVGIEATAPVITDMIWAKAFAKYGAYTLKDKTDTEIAKKSYKLGIDGYIQATSKLAVTPAVYFEGLGKLLTVSAGASYKIGLSDTAINLTVKRVEPFDDDFENQASSLIQAKVTIPF